MAKIIIKQGGETEIHELEVEVPMRELIDAMSRCLDTGLFVRLKSRQEGEKSKSFVFIGKEKLLSSTIEFVQ